MKGKLKGNILAFLTHSSVTFALRTWGRKLENEPKSDRILRTWFHSSSIPEEQIFSLTAS